MTNKVGISTKVSRTLGLTFSNADANVDAVFKAISDELKSGNEVKIPGFGIFNIKDTKPRNGRNPSTGETVQIAASKRISFKPSSVLKSAVK